MAQNLKKTKNLLWTLFYLLIFLVFIKLIGNLSGVKWEDQYPLFNLIFLALPIILMVTHAIHTLGLGKGIFFMSLASITGTFFEYIGLKYGTFFGGHYVYKNQLTVFDVPVSVIFFWAVFIYTGYCLTNSFLLWLKQDKPGVEKKNFWLLPFLILLDGYFVVAIDFFMDPISVKSGSWIWLDGGLYFGVPWGNFLGWFVVTVIVSSIFRTYEYFFTKRKKMIDKPLFIIPVLGYGILSVSFLFSALRFDLPSLAVIGSIFMMPQVIINLLLFKKSKNII
ncbi:MAG: carotenoid biosynthesis protein [Patescibacteria group bacterium]